ncbi:hypothetical protein CRG98_037668 [Punica granatum]|uniref:Uncharacterized protein n=1 Tax=Punica granatum TaxID=22663 RepID=A0A2I0ID45_PUNGR|nr:hypothetical protein CRG98_037668 [Punica granatum]
MGLWMGWAYGPLHGLAYNLDAVGRLRTRRRDGTGRNGMENLAISVPGSVRVPNFENQKLTELINPSLPPPLTSGGNRRNGDGLILQIGFNGGFKVLRRRVQDNSPKSPDLKALVASSFSDSEARLLRFEGGVCSGRGGVADAASQHHRLCSAHIQYRSRFLLLELALSGLCSSTVTSATHSRFLPNISRLQLSCYSSSWELQQSRFLPKLRRPATNYRFGFHFQLMDI